MEIDGVGTINFNNLLYQDVNKEEAIELRKKTSSAMKEIRNRARRDYCYYCGKKVEGFCNSHSVPAFCLKNISVKGVVLNTNEMLGIPTIDTRYGINNATTFHIICKECDNKLFRNYENPSNYEQLPTQEMFAEIDLKNCLRSIDKKFREIELYSLIEEKWRSTVFSELHGDATDLDYLDFERDYNAAKRKKQSGGQNYYMGFHERVPYTVPIAFQSTIPVVFDLEGSLINDIYYKDRNYRIEDLKICVFPLEKYSVIFAFVDSKCKRYRKFFRQLKKMEKQEDRLAIINYLILSYSEECLISPSIEKSTLDELKWIVGKTQDVLLTDIESQSPLEILKQEYGYHDVQRIPNLLAEQYAL